MRIIISPAKKMRTDTDSLDYTGLPLFLSEAERLKTALQGMSAAELRALWQCNGAIATLNIQRLQAMDVHGNLTPAILAYDGIQYRYMGPGVFEDAHFAYIGEHLRILSGFYGLLRPLDGVAPYRLEMQAKLAIDAHTDLYGFWGDKLAGQLSCETDLILNLASKEYSKAVAAHLPKHVRFLTCAFAQEQDGKVIEKGTLCKMARGQMVRWLAEHGVTDVDDIKCFDRLGYRYSEEYSTNDHFVFI